ncbi:hypothetical protein Tco_1201052 [Tanacetum coccineum]
MFLSCIAESFKTLRYPCYALHVAGEAFADRLVVLRNQSDEPWPSHHENVIEDAEVNATYANVRNENPDENVVHEGHDDTSNVGSGVR